MPLSRLSQQPVLEAEFGAPHYGAAGRASRLSHAVRPLRGGGALAETLAELQASMSSLELQHMLMKDLLDQHAEAVRLMPEVSRADIGEREKLHGRGDIRKTEQRKTITPVMEGITETYEGAMPIDAALGTASASSEAINATVSPVTAPDSAELPSGKFKGKTVFWKSKSAASGILHVASDGDDSDRSSTARFTSTVRGVLGSLSATRPQRRTQAVTKIKTRVFPDAEDMKEKVRQSFCSPTRPARLDYYQTNGWWQKIAKSAPFELMTLLAVLANSIWLAFDVSYNHADTVYEAELEFQVVEYCFCTFFFIEIIIRFMAFARKRDCLRDNWFLFDSVLVTTMVLETWVFTIIIAITSAGPGSALGAASVLRVMKLFRLSRVARLGRLFRAMPEFMLVIKSLTMVCRTVLLICLVQMGLVYAWAIMMTQLSKGSALEERYFANVPTAMFSLTLGAIFPDMAPMTNDLGDANWAYALLFGVFILLSTVMMMNMLIGALVEVVGAVADTERETNQVSAISEELDEIVSIIDKDENDEISKAEFNQAIKDPTTVRALRKVGVDVIGLVESATVLFQNLDYVRKEEILELLLQLRASNPAKVKDLTDMRRYLHAALLRLEERLLVQLEHPFYLGKAASMNSSGEGSYPMGSEHSWRSSIAEVRVSSSPQIGVRRPPAAAVMSQLSPSTRRSLEEASQHQPHRRSSNDSVAPMPPPSTDIDEVPSFAVV